MYTDVQAALKLGDYQLIQQRQLLLDAHERSSSCVGIRESRYYTFPARLIQSYYDLDGTTANASDKTPAEVFSALDTKLQVLSQQRAGKDGIPLKNALTDKNYTIEELYSEINVLQQALGVPRTEPSASVESLLYGQKLAFEKELQSVLTQLQLLKATKLSSARGVADRSTTGSGGNIVQQAVSQQRSSRATTVSELTQGVKELKELVKSASDVSAAGAPLMLSPQTNEPYAVDQLIQRVRDLQQVLSGGVAQADSEPSTLFKSDEIGTKHTINFCKTQVTCPLNRDNFHSVEVDEVCDYHHPLHMLLPKVQKECPSLVWFYPKNSMFWLGDPVKYLLNDSLMMVFVCPVTFKVIKCGPQGTGWEVRAPRQFLQKVMPALWMSMFVMQAAVLEGKQVLIPLASQSSPVSVAAALIPNKVVDTALKEKFDGDHFMRCMAAFTDAMKTICDLSDPFTMFLVSEVTFLQDFYTKQMLRSAPREKIISVNIFDESYKSIHAFLTTSDNSKLGKLEDQLRGSMERVMADDGVVEWVSIGASRKWLQMHARCVSLPSFKVELQCGPGEHEWYSPYVFQVNSGGVDPVALLPLRFAASGISKQDHPVTPDDSETQRELLGLKNVLEETYSEINVLQQALSVPLIQRARDLQQTLSEVASASSDPSILPVSGEKNQEWTLTRASMQLPGNPLDDNSLDLLQSQIRKECPSIVWFYPKNNMFWLGDPAQYLLDDTLMMVFVCPESYAVIPCGPQGTGWEVRAPKEFLTQIMPAVLISLFAMQKAVLEGRKISIPLTWQKSPTSAPAAMVLDTAYKNDIFEAHHFMHCSSVFTNAVEKLINRFSLNVESLWNRVKHQQAGRKLRNVPFLKVSLGTEFPPAISEESYKIIHTFLSTGDNVKLGTLEDQLCEQMERVMTTTGDDVHWVSRWRFIPTSGDLYDVAGNGWLAPRLREKGFDERSAAYCEQKLVVKEGVQNEKAFAQISPKDFDADYLYRIGFVGFCIQNVLISVHEEAVKRISSSTTKEPTGDNAEIRKRVQGNLIVNLILPMYFLLNFPVHSTSQLFARSLQRKSS